VLALVAMVSSRVWGQDTLPVEVSEVTVKPGERAVPGTRVVLNVQDVVAAGVRYRWIQSEGPPVAIEDPARPSIEVIVPGGAQRLGFFLLATSRDRVRVVRVTVPIETAAMTTTAQAQAQPQSAVRADAGDDQVALIGRRVTLNGSGSVPAQGLAYRWLQLGGPPVVAPRQDRAFYSFIPSAAGLYRFALLVAVGGAISEPDEVVVTVGGAPAVTEVANHGPATATQTVPDQILGAALPRIASGAIVAPQVADVFESIAGRSDLYTSFAEMQDELRRRLDVVIPAEPIERQAWTQSVFQPLTAYTASQLAVVGLDLQWPQSLSQPLTLAQRQAVHGHFLTLAHAFRAVSGMAPAEGLK